MQGSFQGSEWQRWLDVSASTEDCKLSSHARRATLNLESAQALASAEVRSSVSLALSSWSSRVHCSVPTSYPQGKYARGMVTWRIAQMDEVGMRQPLSGAAGSGNTALQGPRLVMRDTVHLFDPGARHHHVLATEGTATASPGTIKTGWPPLRGPF